MLQNVGNLLPLHPVPSVSGRYTRRQRTPSIAPMFTHPRFRYPLHTFVCRRPLPYLLTLSGSDAYRLRDFVVKVQRVANYRPFGGATRYDTGDTLAGEVLLDLCTYDNMNIKSCQKVTKSKQFISFSELYIELLGYIT